MEIDFNGWVLDWQLSRYLHADLRDVRAWLKRRAGRGIRSDGNMNWKIAAGVLRQSLDTLPGDLELLADERRNDAALLRDQQEAAADMYYAERRLRGKWGDKVEVEAR